MIQSTSIRPLPHRALARPRGGGSVWRVSASMEIWKNVIHGYLVSNTGIVKSKRTGRPLCQCKSKSGYMRVHLCLWGDGSYKWFSVHRLVLLAFVGEPPSKDHKCDHINGVRSDNRLSNLRWATSLQNSHNRNSVGVTNTSGYLNVHYAVTRKKWVATMRVNGRHMNFGSHQTAEQANEVMIRVRKEMNLDGLHKHKAKQ